MYSQKWNCAASLFPKQNYNVQSPNSHNHISVSDLYISRIGLSILLQPNMWTDPGNIYIAHRHMNVEIGTEAAQFPEKEYINGIFVAVWELGGIRFELDEDRVEPVLSWMMTELDENQVGSGMSWTRLDGTLIDQETTDLKVFFKLSGLLYSNSCNNTRWRSCPCWSRRSTPSSRRQGTVHSID